MSLIICVLSGLFWSFFDLTRKLSVKQLSPETFLTIFSFIQIIVFFIWCLYKDTMLIVDDYFFTGLILVLMNVSSALLFLKSIKLSDLSMTIPLLSFTPLFSAIFSFLFIEEKLTIYQYVGISFIISGTMVLYSKSFEISEIFYSLVILKNNLAAKYMLSVSLMWSMTPILDKICLKSASISVHGLIQSITITIILLLVFNQKIKSEFNIIMVKKQLIFVTITIGTVATILQFFAIINTYVSIMESIKRSMGQFGSLFFGKLYFNEEVTLQKILGILIISFGIFFILTL